MKSLEHIQKVHLRSADVQKSDPITRAWPHTLLEESNGDRRVKRMETRSKLLYLKIPRKCLFSSKALKVVQILFKNRKKIVYRINLQTSPHHGITLFYNFLYFVQFFIMNNNSLVAKIIWKAYNLDL